jgi:Amylo-alpha-1,6-glucosidase
MITRREAIKTGALAGIALAALPRAFAQTTSSAPASAAADTAALAAQILADKTLTQVHSMAQDLLKSGLNAGSGYDQVWIRDGNTFIEVALEVNPPDRFREAFLNFFKFQGDNGNVVDGYRHRDSNKVKDPHFSPLAPDLVAFKNSVETDQESSLVQALFKYVGVTNDKSILEESVAGVTVQDRLGRALSYVLTERFDRKHGLVWGGTRADWGDVQPEDSPGVVLNANSHRALTVYDSAMLLVALNDYIQLMGGEDSPGARHWKHVRDKLKRNVRKYLWDAKNQKFIPHVYLDGSPFPKDFDENAIYYHGGTAVAIEAGLLSRDEVAGALKRMNANVRAANASSIGLTMYPPYPNGYFKNPQLTKPYTYQNGGDWCWFGGRMIQQLVAYGYVAEAYRNLQPMVERVVRVGDFHEWWSRDNQPKGSGGFRGSAGVLGKAIVMLQVWARQQNAN